MATQMWAAHSDRLARGLSDDEWQAVESAYNSVAVILLGRRADEQTAQNAESARDSIRDALKRLG